MSDFYNPQRTKNLYNPQGSKPFKISRSKLESFIQCPRCFYLDRKCGVGQPPGFPFNLNSAVDTLLKKEFDHYRGIQEPHPLMADANIDAVPMQHEDLEAWRDSLRRGISYLHVPTNILVSGGVDDVWITPREEVIIVDYKATSKTEAVNIDAPWQMGYKRQMSIYAWLFKMNGFKVFPTGYFVYCNGRTDRNGFNARLDFDISVLPFALGEDRWIEEALLAMKKTLDADQLPASGEGCDYCRYTEARRRHEIL